jgi:hypothetical protein
MARTGGAQLCRGAGSPWVEEDQPAVADVADQQPAVGKEHRIVRVGQLPHVRSGMPRKAIPVDDVTGGDVDDADDLVLFLCYDDLFAVRCEDIVRTDEGLAGRQVPPGRGNSQSVRPCGSTITRRLLPSSAMMTGEGRTDGSDPGARKDPVSGLSPARPWRCWRPPAA